MAVKPTPNRLLPKISDEELANSTTKALVKKYKLNNNQVHQIRQRRGVRMTTETLVAAYAERDSARPSVAKLNAVFDEEPPDHMSWLAFHERLDAIKGMKAVESKYDPRRHKLECALPGSKPIGIVFTGDWQLGSAGVDYAAWEEATVDKLWGFHKADPTGLYAIGLGDYQSALGTIHSRGSQHQDIDSAGNQYSVLQTFFHLTRGMWLVLVQGCHDTFTLQSGDIDPVERYCELSGARHGWHGTELTVRLGKQNYVMRLRHRYRFNSALNPLNSQRRQVEMEGAADVVAHGHLHTSQLGESAAGGQDVVMLRSGSYQIDSEFARQYVGNVQADPRMPLIIIWPGTKRIWSVRDFREGLDYLKMLREKG